MPKAYVFTRYGGPEVEAFADVERPVPGPGQVLVAVRAAGVNPVDWKQREGHLAQIVPVEFPAVFGREVSGVVEQTGDGVTEFAAGDAVFGNTVAGGFARYALLPRELTARKPDGLSFADAATLPVAAATAYDGVRQLGLPAGATLLITGVGGGVGVAAAQIARHTGVTVIGTAGPGKKDFVESLGVVHVEPGPGVADRIRAAAPDGVDAVYDLVGGAALEEAAEVLKDRSKLISAADGETVTRLGGSLVLRARDRATLEAVADLAASGALRPYVTRTFPLAQAPEALRAVEDGHARGKIVIEVDA
ncbi:NADP-dependent oxidoreductase [Microbispora sp. SCL1-1]|uniref:NADP-dependent oxidoreductase n=1 Tax=Microbispora TaxID=2005 RepID=UPI00115982A4|nr:MULTISPECIES: NADP-dependent oxidoreductase [unclassified Microbispora]NJP27301.1 NADP-dependent oxidoreductase [Microbispora sp. CL1-1]TQS11350.1 NADP-dependent oxidoreductase [Microbispora sp. SCL1-1]